MAEQRVSGGTKIVYAAVGSGAGVDKIKAGKVDFAASDRPLPPDELAKAGLGQFPLVSGSVIRLFTSLPIASLDRLSPQKRLNEIGESADQPVPGR
jgi:phosphate transport system substrate-binding protein